LIEIHGRPSDVVPVCEDYKRIAGSGVYLKSLAPAPNPHFFIFLYFALGLELVTLSLSGSWVLKCVKKRRTDVVRLWVFVGNNLLVLQLFFVQTDFVRIEVADIKRFVFVGCLGYCEENFCDAAVFVVAHCVGKEQMCHDDVGCHFYHASGVEVDVLGVFCGDN
jgi:hypothetical protein